MSSAAPESVAPSPIAASSEPSDPCVAPIVDQASTVPVPDPDALTLRICDPGGFPKSLGRDRPVVLGENDANNIGKLLDLAPAGSVNCENQPDAVLRFNYRDGTQADVEIFAVPDPGGTACNQSTASVDGRVWLLGQTFADFLLTDAIAPGLPGNPVPDVTGLSLAQATSVITRAGLTIRSGGRVTDPLLSADTVVMQDPPAATGIIGNEVDVLLSQQPARTCVAGQLAIDYSGVSYGTGNAFSSLDVRDIGATPCTLNGSISVVGLDAAGHVVTSHETLQVASDLILSAHAPEPAVDGSVPNGVVIAWVPIQADVRDGPDADGSCVGHLVVPRKWLLDVAGDAKVAPNGDGTAQSAMSACEGQLTVPPQISSQVTPIN
jgi:PASTA domain